MRWIDLAHPCDEAMTHIPAGGVAGRRLTIGVFPLKIKVGDGAPARIFALET